MTGDVLLRKQESRAAEDAACGPGLLLSQEHTASFTQSAARLAGLAGALLGWRPGEFWGATPAELAAVIDAMAQDEAAGGLPADGGDLERLREQFPDG